MKIFKDITDTPNKTLMKNLHKISFGLFGLGLFTGIALILVGVSSKNNDYENTFIMTGITLFFLLLSTFIYTFLRKRLLPEIEGRLNAGKKI